MELTFLLGKVVNEHRNKYRQIICQAMISAQKKLRQSKGSETDMAAVLLNKSQQRVLL